ncbi:hypothetical protein D9M71_789120 [compost metagenome]
MLDERARHALVGERRAAAVVPNLAGQRANQVDVALGHLQRHQRVRKPGLAREIQRVKVRLKHQRDIELRAVRARQHEIAVAVLHRRPAVERALVNRRETVVAQRDRVATRP